MVDIHILNGSDDGTVYQCAFHFTVPDATNEAAINYRTIISVYENTESVVPNIDPGEQQQLNNGELLEDVVAFRTHPNRPDQLEKIRALYQERFAFWQDAIPKKYKYTGHTLAAE